MLGDRRGVWMSKQGHPSVGGSQGELVNREHSGLSPRGWDTFKPQQ